MAKGFEVHASTNSGHQESRHWIANQYLKIHPYSLASLCMLL